MFRSLFIFGEIDLAVIFTAAIGAGRAAFCNGEGDVLPS
jgi:hypothetical protein